MWTAGPIPPSWLKRCNISTLLIAQQLQICQTNVLSPPVRMSISRRIISSFLWALFPPWFGSCIYILSFLHSWPYEPTVRICNTPVFIARPRTSTTLCRFYALEGFQNLSHENLCGRIPRPVRLRTHPERFSTHWQ